MEKLYTLKEASQLLGVSTRTIQLWDKQGRIKCIRTAGGRRRVPAGEIERILGLRIDWKLQCGRTVREALRRYCADKGFRSYEEGLKELLSKAGYWPLQES